MAIGLAWVIVTVTPVTEWWARLLAGEFRHSRGEVLVVLGADYWADGLLAEASYHRSGYAVRAWRESQFRQVVIVGGGPAVAGRMADYLRFHGIPGEAIRVEQESASTRENAVFAQRILADIPGRKVLLTSDYHMFRAGRAFRRAGVEFGPYPISDAIKRCSRPLGRWSVFQTLALETVKILYYGVRGWL
jgi:uncharacterized SAM-binding protein YcdF (DUF218 family)